MRYPILLLTILLSAPGTGAAQVDTPPLLMQHPTLSTTRIAFSYAGDLWTVSRTGGEAIRLTTGVGAEIDPYFSPDGRLLAFTGEYDGNIDVYVVPASGGVPRRLTYHPGVDRAAGWTPDGKQVLFVSGRNSYSNRFGRLFTMPLDGASAAEVPLPMGYEGVVLARRDSTRLCADRARLQSLEALPRGHDDAHLGRQADRFERRENPPGKLERLQPDLGRQQGFLSVGSQRAGHAVFL